MLAPRTNMLAPQCSNLQHSRLCLAICLQASNNAAWGHCTVPDSCSAAASILAPVPSMLALGSSMLAPQPFVLHWYFLRACGHHPLLPGVILSLLAAVVLLQVYLHHGQVCFCTLLQHACTSAIVARTDNVFVCFKHI
jgi:hypothetical protein